MALPTVDDILTAAADALTTPHKERRHADKRVAFRSPQDVIRAVGAQKALTNGAQFRVVARAKDTSL